MPKPHWLVALLALALSHLHGQSKTEVELRRQLALSEMARAADARRSAALMEAVERLTVAVKSGKNIAVKAAGTADANASEAREIAERGVRDAATAEAGRKLSYDTAKMISENTLRGIVSQNRNVLIAGALAWGGSIIATLLTYFLTRKKVNQIEVNTNSMSERLQALSLEKGRRDMKKEIEEGEA